MGILFALTVLQHDAKVLAGMLRQQQLAAYKEKFKFICENESQQISGFVNKEVTKGEGRRQGLQQGQRESERGKGCSDDWQKLKGTNSEERARGDKGEDREAVSGMREGDAVGGAKLQLHCARRHLFRKEYNGVNNKQAHTDGVFISTSAFIAFPTLSNQNR